MRADLDERALLLESILNASILTWRHVSLHGTYDFSNLLSANEADYSFDDVISFKAFAPSNQRKEDNTVDVRARSRKMPGLFHHHNEAPNLMGSPSGSSG